jgi:hypothetical protein
MGSATSGGGCDRADLGQPGIGHCPACGRQSAWLFDLAGRVVLLADGLYWHDRKTGILYHVHVHVHAIETEECEVQGTHRGTDRRKTALSRLVRGPAIVACRFDA